MISLRLMEDTMEDYAAMRNWFLEPELQEWVWCDEKGEPPVSMVQIIHQKHPDIKELFIDPDVENIRAIRCYQNAGFQCVGEIVDDEGDRCLLHKIVF